MATLAAIKAAVNARLASLWPVVKTKQEAYRAAKGHYFQGILTSAPPDDGATVAPSLSNAATDQYDYTPPVLDINGTITVPEVKTFHSWSYFGINGTLPAQIECAVEMSAYEAPGGVHGYYCTVSVTKAGITYTRTAQVEQGVELTTGSWSS